MSVSEENGSLLTFDERRMAIMNEVHDIMSAKKTSDTKRHLFSQRYLVNADAKRTQEALKAQICECD